MQRSPPPPLLPWQILLVCAACGILAVRVPVGAGAACLAVALLAAVTGSKRGCLALVPVAFGLGLGAAWLALPAPPTRLAAVVLTGKKNRPDRPGGLGGRPARQPADRHPGRGTP